MSNGNSNPLIAYVHNVSPLKRNKRNTMNYTTLRLQFDSDCKDSDHSPRDALCFSKTKRKLLVEKEQSRTPVKISKYTYTTDKSKLIINDFTQLENVKDLETAFQYKEEKVKLSTLKEVKNDENNDDDICVVAKVTKLAEPSTVGKKSEWKVVNGFVADCTGTMEIEFWNDYIKQVSLGGAYRFINLRKRFWKGMPKLTTMYSSKISECAKATVMFQNIEIDESKDEESTEELTTLSVPCIEAVKTVVKFKRCIECNRRILQPQQKVLHCDHCSTHMRADRCKTSIFATFTLKVENENRNTETVELTAFDDVLQKFVPEHKAVTVMEEKEVAEIILFLNDLTITYNDQNICTSIHSTSTMSLA